jgi:hypothetical protein
MSQFRLAMEASMLWGCLSSEYMDWFDTLVDEY